MRIDAFFEVFQLLVRLTLGLGLVTSQRPKSNLKMWCQTGLFRRSGNRWYARKILYRIKIRITVEHLIILNVNENLSRLNVSEYDLKFLTNIWLYLNPKPYRWSHGLSKYEIISVKIVVLLESGGAKGALYSIRTLPHFEKDLVIFEP